MRNQRHELINCVVEDVRLGTQSLTTRRPTDASTQCHEKMTESGCGIIAVVLFLLYLRDHRLQPCRDILLVKEHVIIGEATT